LTLNDLSINVVFSSQIYPGSDNSYNIWPSDKVGLFRCSTYVHC